LIDNYFVEILFRLSDSFTFDSFTSDLESNLPSVATTKNNKTDETPTDDFPPRFDMAFDFESKIAKLSKL